MLLNSKIVNKGWALRPFKLLSVSGKILDESKLVKPNGLVIAFICNHCPYVKDILSRMLEDFNELKKLNVGLVAIMPNDVDSYPEDSFDKMIEFAKSHKFHFDYLYDEQQNVANIYGAICTPDFFCFDKNRKLFYRGRLDNLTFQAKDKKFRKKELLNAFRLKIEKNIIESTQYPSIGCSIKWKKNT